MTKFSKTNLGILPYLRWSSLQQLAKVGLTTSGQYFHVTVVTPSSLLAKLRLDRSGHVLKAVSDTLSCFAYMLLHFFKHVDYFCFTNTVSLRKLIATRNTTHCNIQDDLLHLRPMYNRDLCITQCNIYDGTFIVKIVSQ